MRQQNNTALYSGIFVFFAGITAAGMLIPRHHSLSLGLAYFSAFFVYFWLCQFPPSKWSVLTIGVAVRLLLFLTLPMLSDDIYRFIWDGKLLQNGLSPFAQLPSTIAGEGNFANGLNDELYQNLNSKDYFTIYPPLNQLIFWLGASIGGESWLTSANIIRVFLLVADVGSFFLLRKLLLHWKKDEALANWYFLNPLVILEGVGNLHFEVLVTAFLLLGLYLYHKQKSFPSGFSFGLAIATKLLPLIYLPALLLRKPFKSGLITVTSAVVLVAASFVPLIDEALLHSMTTSIGLYFQKFEFNASIYFLLREVGYWMTGYNVIGTLGPALSVITFLLIIGLAIIGRIKKWPIERIMLVSLTVYLLLATTVHPWYIIPLISLGILTGYRFPLIWSLLIFVTYFGYNQTGFELSAGWLVVEYTVVLSVLIIELFKKNHGTSS